MANATPGRERERERELFLENRETHLGTHSHMWSGCLAGWRRSCPSSEHQYAQYKIGGAFLVITWAGCLALHVDHYGMLA